VLLSILAKQFLAHRLRAKQSTRVRTVNSLSFKAEADIGVRDEYGTLILDRVGKIISCGLPAEKIFGVKQDRLMGRWISEFIAGLFLGGNSQCNRAKYLEYLCTDGEWRKFEAMDAGGHGFAVEINMARVATDGREVVVLNVHRPEEHVSS
jgi:PAS domain S-box-containing protein